MKTSELIGWALDWAVEECLGSHNAPPTRCHDCRFFEERHGPDDPEYYCRNGGWEHMEYGWSKGTSPVYGVWDDCPITALTPEKYSTDWTYGGPIIERERMMIKNAGSVWVAYDYGQGYFGQGQTPLIAAMRCYVASKLGDEVDVPSELTD